jgi:RND family efflux transporter MFP subunit
LFAQEIGMKLTKLRIGVLVVGVLGLVGLGYAFSGPSDVQTFVTDVVKRGGIAQTVEVTGELKSVSDLELSFETSGTVAAIFVEVGDTVNAGDVLAELGTSELGAAAEQARQGVAAAQAELNLRLEGVSSEEEAVERAGVAVAEAQLSSASIDVNAALIAQSTGDAQDAVTVASAQSDYDQVAAQNAEATTQAAEDLDAALGAALIAIRSGLETTDQILGVENTLLNNEINEYVGILDRNVLNYAVDAFRQAADARDDAEDAVLALTSSSAESEVLAAYLAASAALSSTSNTLLYTSRVLDASMSDSGDFSNADLIALRVTIANERTAVSSAISSLLSAKQAYDSALRVAGERLTDAVNSLALAVAQQSSGVASRAAAVAKADAAVAVQTANVTQAQARLAQVLADPRDIDVAGLRASVGRAEAEYAAAVARLRKAQVIAPIDGVVSDIAFDIGEQVPAGTAMISQIAGDDVYELVLDVPEADIAKLAVGQSADVTFDAFGDRVVFVGAVYSVSPAEHTISDVVFYEVKVVLNTDQDVSMLKSGMSADVVIHSSDRTDALYVPNRAILEKNNTPYVRVPKGEREFEEVSVTVGLKADNGVTEILSGVTEGQTIIISIKTE